MKDEDINTLLTEAFEHLWNGRYRLALQCAEKVYYAKPDDSDAAICLAWALLENGNPAKAMDFANLAVELKADSVKARVYRAFLLYRMSIFEGSIADINQSISSQKETLAWSYLNKAKALAGLQKYDEACQALDLAVIIDNGENPSWKELKKWIEKAKLLNHAAADFFTKYITTLLEEASKAIKEKEYWYSLLLANKILAHKKSDEAQLILLESMLYLFQIKPALKLAESLNSRFGKNEKFISIYNALKKFSQLEQEQESISIKSSTRVRDTRSKVITQQIDDLKYNASFFPNEYVDVFSINFFDVEEEELKKDRIFIKKFDKSIRRIGTEVIFYNPFFEKADKKFSCKAVWYLNDFQIYTNNFQLNIKKQWDSVIFVQVCGSSEKDFWKKGQGKVEIYISNFKICERFFGVGSNRIDEEIKTDELQPAREDRTKVEEPVKPEVTKTIEPRVVRPLNELLDELNSFTGLTSIKEAIKNFIAYLEFLKERKKLGLKAEDSISINAVFLGNPGTGKTTIARMLGDIFYAMGILPKGHVVEVDRAALVGEYIGQTALKTDKVINDAIGGVLFIDEAYTLIKKGAGNDFGQEAIDVLLKRMEDRKGEFVVIAAGYTDEMNGFLNSNPGLKSRFTHTFVFEDYTPDELLLIFEGLLKKEDYVITDDAKDALKKEFMSLYRARDKSFGNARLIRKLFESAKMNLSKVCQNLSEENRTKEAMTTFSLEVINKSFSKSSVKEVHIPINEESLTEALSELQNLVGLENLKKDIVDMVKLARYLNEQGEDIKKVFSEHILFLGNPGTGKTTVARIFGRIYSSLGIIPKGHLVETDRQGLVAGYVGQTAEKTTGMVDRALGGMLFIDEAYTLVKKGDSGSDFGKEAIDILLKRMEDDKGKFIVVAAGYTDEMQQFVASNPGIQSRFSKSFTFDDYNPEELIEIVQRAIKKENKNISAQAEQKLKNHFQHLYNTRDKKFGNARIVRNILDSIKQKMLLRLAEIPSSERTDDKISTIEIEDINEVLNREIEAKQFEVKGDPLRLQKEIDNLNNLIGLETVKNDVFKLISFAKLSQIKKVKGLQAVERNLHSIFIGNIGTGKRTVAKSIGRIFKELGVLDNGHVLEVDRSDFIAGYQGQSSVKTDKLIQQALGGILFIKDAHTLFKLDDPYGEEVVETIVKRIHEFKGRLVLILSGSQEEINSILKINQGLKSYFPNIFNFPDYTPRELLAVAVSISEHNGYNLDEGALQEMLDLFSKAEKIHDKNLRNGILAKHILFSAITNQEERIFSIYEKDDVDLKTITLDDVEKIIL